MLEVLSSLHNSWMCLLTHINPRIIQKKQKHKSCATAVIICFNHSLCFTPKTIPLVTETNCPCRKMESRWGGIIKWNFWSSKQSKKRCEVLDMMGWWSSRSLLLTLGKYSAAWKLKGVHNLSSSTVFSQAAMGTLVAFRISRREKSSAPP